MLEPIDLQCLTRRTDLLAEEAEMIVENLGKTWADRLRDLGDYGRSGGSAADRRQIIETLAHIERGRVMVRSTERSYPLEVLTDHPEALARQARARVAARLRWDTPHTLGRSEVVPIGDVMARIERGELTARLIPDGYLDEQIRALAADAEKIALLSSTIADAQAAMDDDEGSNDAEHDALRAVVDVILDQPVDAKRRRLAETEYDVVWKYTATGATSPEDAARQAWRIMRNADSIANVFEVTDRHGVEHEIDLASIDRHPDA